MARTGSLLWPAVVAVLLVLSMGGTALARDQGENTPITASGAAGAAVSTAAASPGCGKAPTLQAAHTGNTTPPGSYTLNGTACG